MKFAQSTFVYFNYPLQEAIKRLHINGYDGVEIWGGRPHYYRRDLDHELKDILALLDEYEMVVPNFIPAQFRYPSLLCSLNEGIRKDSVMYIKDNIDTALQLHAASISICPGMLPFGENLLSGWAQLQKSIIELLDYASSAAIKILIEPAHKAETNLILTVDQCLEMLDRVNSDMLGILVDTGHTHLNNEALDIIIPRLKNIPLHIHIDDNNGDADAHMIPCDGKIDYAPLVRALKDIQYNGFISAELGFQYTLDPDAAVKTTMERLGEIFYGKE